MAEGGTFNQRLCEFGVADDAEFLRTGAWNGNAATRIPNAPHNAEYFVPWFVKANPGRFPYLVLPPDEIDARVAGMLARCGPEKRNSSVPAG